MAGKSDSKKFDAKAFLENMVPSVATNPELMAAAEALRVKDAERRSQQLQDLMQGVGSRHTALLNSLRNLRAATDKAEVALKADMELLKSKLQEFVEGTATADDVTALLQQRQISYNSTYADGAINYLKDMKKTVVSKD